MRLAFLALTLFACVPGSVRAQEVRSIEIVEYGIYTADITSTERLPNGLESNTLANICHVATSMTVPAKLGVHFGFRYRVDGASAGQVVEIRKVVQFPTSITPRGTQRPVAAYEHTSKRQVGATSFTGYGFDHPHELVQGSWTFQIWHEQRKHAELVFTAADPAGLSFPSAANSRCFQVSKL